MKRFLPLLLLACGPVLLSGCLAPIPPKARLLALKKPEPRPIPARVNGKGWHIVWRSRNTAKANTKAVPVLIADAETGALDGETEPPTIRLETVQAQIYQMGRHIANIEAAQIEANRRDQVLHASGGVTVHSLIKPADTVITADKMTWDTNTNHIVAEGNARILRPARGKAPAFSQSGNRIAYDMKQDTFDLQ